MNYRDQLKTKKWKLFSDKIKNRDGNKCVRCGSRKNLNAHHLFYKKGKKAWEYDEHELITLCSNCHKKEHNDINKLNNLINFFYQLGVTANDIYKYLRG